MTIMVIKLVSGNHFWSLELYIYPNLNLKRHFYYTIFLREILNLPKAKKELSISSSSKLIIRYYF